MWWCHTGRVDHFLRDCLRTHASVVSGRKTNPNRVSSPAVSIVIVTWNGKELLERFLPSVRKTEFPRIEIVIADNASTDGTAEWLAEAAPEVRVIQHPENWLFAQGNNEAIRQTNAPYVCLLNNDVEVPTDWLEPLVSVLDANPDVAAVQPKLLQHSDRSRFEYAGACGGFIDKLGYPFARGRLFSTMEFDEGQYNEPRDVSWATGACLLMRRSAFDAAGGLDEAFGMHMEEIDLCLRFWRAGMRVRVEPTSTVYHLGGASLSKGSPRKTYLNFRNNLLMLYKNTPLQAWPGIFRTRKLMDSLAIARGLIGGGLAESRAIRHAYRDASSMFAQYREDRPVEASTATPIYQGSIVIDYYLKRRRHFSDLSVERFRGQD